MYLRLTFAQFVQIDVIGNPPYFPHDPERTRRKVLEPGEAWFLEARDRYLERFSQPGVPIEFRRMASYGYFAYHGPSYYFSDSDFGKQIELTPDQIQDIRKKWLRISKTIKPQLEQAMLLACSDLLSSLSKQQRKKQDDWVGLKNIELIASKQNASRLL